MKLRLRAPGFSGIGEVLGFSWDLGSSEGSGEAPGGKGGVKSRFSPPPWNSKSQIKQGLDFWESLILGSLVLGVLNFGGFGVSDFGNL